MSGIPLKVGRGSCRAGIRILVKYQLDCKDKGGVAVLALGVYNLILSNRYLLEEPKVSLKLLEEVLEK